MIKSRIAAAAALLAVAGAANADVSVDLAWVSDYDWRGVSQTAGHDAVQLGATYSADSGFYAGLWGSSLLNNNEIDVFAGFAGDIGTYGWTYDVGVNYYTYTNDKDANFGELYAGVAYGVFDAKLWWSPDFGGKYTAGSTDAFYLEANAAVPLGNDFSFLAHVGYSDGDGIAAVYGAGDSYFDWSAGIGYDVGNFSTFIKYADGSDISTIGNAGSRFLFGVSTTLPW